MYLEVEPSDSHLSRKSRESYVLSVWGSMHQPYIESVTALSDIKIFLYRKYLIYSNKYCSNNLCFIFCISSFSLPCPLPSIPHCSPLLSSTLHALPPPSPLTSFSFIIFYLFPLSHPHFLHSTLTPVIHHIICYILYLSHLFSLFLHHNSRYIALVLTLPYSLPPTSCSYLRLCKEWLDLRPAANDAAPLSPMVFLSRLHYIIELETHTYALKKRMDMKHMLTCIYGHMHSPGAHKHTLIRATATSVSAMYG